MSGSFIRTHEMQFKQAAKNERAKIVSLLQENSLPVDDLDLNSQTFIVAVSNGRIIGCIGIEIYREHALLRSLAVQESFRGKGIAHDLINRLIELARKSKVQHLHLLTTTAKEYFLKRGFIEKSRTDAPTSIQSTKEFSILCPSGSTYMVLS